MTGTGLRSQLVGRVTELDAAREALASARGTSRSIVAVVLLGSLL